MKKMLLCSVLAIIIATGFTSCQKEGPIGPAGTAGRDGENGAKGDKGDKGEKGDKGDRGDKGDAGAKGDPGNMTIIAGNFSFGSSNWVVVNAGPVQGTSYGFRAEHPVAEITRSILDGGAVLVYHLVSGGSRLLPYTGMNNGEITYSMLSDVSVGKIAVNVGYASARTATPGNQSFRAIIIPGAVSGRMQAGNRTAYSIDQLRSMSYREVCAVLGIAQ